MIIKPSDSKERSWYLNPKQDERISSSLFSIEFHLQNLSCDQEHEIETSYLYELHKEICERLEYHGFEIYSEMKPNDMFLFAGIFPKIQTSSENSWESTTSQGKEEQPKETAVIDVSQMMKDIESMFQYMNINFTIVQKESCFLLASVQIF